MEHRQDVCWQHSRRGFGHVVSPVSEPSTGDASCSNWNKFSLLSSQTWTCGSPVPRQGIKGARHPFLQGTAPLSQPSVKALVSPHKMFFHHFASLYRTAGLFGVVLVVCLFSVDAPGNAWECFIVQKAPHPLGSSLSGAELWCGQHTRVWLQLCH